MNKTNCITFLMVLCFIPFMGWSQQKFRSLEFEVGGGYAMATALGKRLDALELFLELRSNIPCSKFDIGVQICLAGTLDDESYNSENHIKYLKETGTFMIPFVDYNFRRGRKVSYFVGSGIGMMHSKINNDNTYSSISIVPRVGMEFFNHLRLTMDYKWNPKGEYNYAGISVGVVFGGGVKKG